ncbi:GerAB/ArcD/ProY family transporter [Clostridium sp. MSJ-8]|uniref:YkvI family membrane protein n=1 Tax=Clostridium sp. MSJ-8 TaxID=2841510 RepID=UPI001C0F2FB9|nr:GerAB/ArcD/ProY family transporter [Clostridium sp. MSJ-8]MBU5486771.1 GerAB/ArcD/ProY family transporter [Clostridium sp. MSJ-8]
MKKDHIKIFQIAVVFIGTIVGAGLASGKEITTFFTCYGLKSFIGIILCGFFYIFIGSLLSKISINYNLTSYSDVMNTISPNILGKITGIITTLYLISSASIILAGSGALLNQFFGIPRILGSILMLLVALFFLLKGTNGLIEVNSFIVPGLITTITLITILYFLFARDILSIDYLTHFKPQKNGFLLSTILYAGYNTLCSSGVIVPLSSETKDFKTMKWGIILGSTFLCILCAMINLLLTANQPYIYNYEIPLLLVSNRFGTIIQAILLIIILLEMFSTEVSDVYSISKSIEHTFKIPFKKGIFIVLAIALPISQIGFSNLISTLYPMFGVLSLIFIVQCIIFNNKQNKISKTTMKL